MISVVYNSGQQATNSLAAMNRAKNPKRQTRRKSERARFPQNQGQREAIRDYRPMSPNSWFWIAVFSGLLLMAGYWLATNHDGGRADKENLSLQPETLLREMLASYRNLNAYADRTSIRMKIPTAQGVAVEQADMIVAFQRPKRLRIQISRPDSDLKIDCAINESTVAVDIVDGSTNSFDGQFVRRNAPARLTVSDLYAATEYADVTAPGELFSLLTSLPAQLQVSQLAMIMDDSPLQPLIAGAKDRKRLVDETLDGHDCYRGPTRWRNRRLYILD